MPTSDPPPPIETAARRLLGRTHLEVWHVLGVPMPDSLRRLGDLERRACADAALRFAVTRGWLRQHTAPIREPPVWWTRTPAGEAAFRDAASPKEPL
ncbi:MAG TPA: hypothetical protein VGE72_13130 [Azospirillum sp.]